MEVVAHLKSRTGRGTVEVYREGGRLVCSCGQPHCDHLAVGVIAASAGVAVVDEDARYEVLGSFKSESSDATYFVKREKATGQISCNCRGWIMNHKRGRVCWHVERINARLAA
jgi:hypothetical protein